MKPEKILDKIIKAAEKAKEKLEAGKDVTALAEKLQDLAVDFTNEVVDLEEEEEDEDLSDEDDESF